MSKARMRMCDTAAPPLTIGGVNLRCLAPLVGARARKGNNASMIIRLSNGQSSFLFAGDLEAGGERELVASGANLRSTVLKVPHHGSRTSSSPELVGAVRPAAAVASLGYHNRFHFPAPQIVDRYKAGRIVSEHR
jgi:competence protein ComEC